MKRRIALVLLLVLTVVAFAACAQGETTQEDTANAGEEEIVIGMISANLAEPWNVQMDEDVRTAAGEHENVKVLFKDAQNDVLRQRAQLEEFVSQKVDAILISPIEAVPMTEPVEAAMEAGIPVFVIGRKIASDNYTQYIGTDDFALGYAAGQWIVDNFGGESPNVVELKGLMTSTPGAERHEGFMKAIEGSDVNVIHSADAKWLEDVGRSEMESVLARFDDIDVVFGGNDPAAHGAYVAAKSAGKEQEIAFFGIDGLVHEGRAYVKDGVFAMTIFDATGGDIALHNAMKYLDGESIEKEVIKDAIVFEKDNLETGGMKVILPEGVK